MIIDDIAANRVETLHLSDVPQTYFGDKSIYEFLDALRSNTSIKKIIFDTNFLACCSIKDRAAIVSTVGKLPNVESVVLADCYVRIGICMTDLVKNAQRLQELRLEHCHLHGQPADFDRFLQVIKTNGNKTKIQLNGCHAPHEDVDLDSMFAPLIQ